MTENDKPSFIKVGKGGKVKGLIATNNKLHGDCDFINNEGEIENALIERNKHFNKSDKHGKEGWKIMIVGALLAAVLAIAGMALYDFYVKPSLDKTLGQQPQTAITAETG